VEAAKDPLEVVRIHLARSGETDLRQEAFLVLKTAMLLMLIKALIVGFFYFFQ
jgi:hypothetical protein